MHVIIFHVENKMRRKLCGKYYIYLKTRLRFEFHLCPDLKGAHQNRSPASELRDSPPEEHTCVGHPGGQSC